MMQHLFILLCLRGGISLILSVPRKYYLIQQNEKWSDAQAYCKASHTDLAIIQSNDNMVRLQNEVQTQQFISSAWIGLYDDFDSWRWSLGNEPLGDLRIWKENEPNNHNGAQSCVVTREGSWADKKCTDILEFVCYDDTKTGNERYIYISDGMTWHDAQAHCRNHYTDLASARTTVENSAIMALTSNIVWFGLSRDTWKWTDQTNFSTINWITGQPDNELKNEYCGYLNNGQAGDTQCSETMPFFCYSEITGKQQIMRMEMRSSKGANDPAVMDAIMEKIKQKLQNHGLAGNVTVKWRLQPDGKVFHKKKEKKLHKKMNCISAEFQMV